MKGRIEEDEDHMKLLEEEVGEESPIHGDLLEVVFAYVPLIDLVAASRVSKLWEYTVSSSLFHVNKLKPWLMIQAQSTRSPTKKTMTYTYDPRSDTWIEIIQSSVVANPRISIIQSSYPTFVYQLCPKGLSYSLDPLHQIWHNILPPSTWRVDPIVAIVGPHIIVAGGASGFEDDPLTVEMYDMEGSHWSTCQSMPDILKDSAASTWLSVASNHKMMYVTEKASGITYSFSPKAKGWCGPYDLRPDPAVYFSAIGFAGDDLIIAGLIGHSQDVKTLKLWKIELELMKFDEIGEIPLELLEKLKGENLYFLSSISLLATKDFIYMYNSSDPAEIIFCEFIGGKCKWGSVKNMVWNDERKIGERMVMSCGRVGIADLHMATKSGDLKFLVKSQL